MPRIKKDVNNPEEAFKDVRKDITGETAVNHINGEPFITFYSSEYWGIKLALQCLEEHPEKCKLAFKTTNDDGKIDGIQITMPEASIRYIKFPVKRNLTDEQRKEISERMKKLGESRKGKKRNEK